MTRTYSREGISITFMWIGSVIFFMIAECLVILSERGQLKGLSPVRLWSLPFMVAVPLIAGVGFAAQIHRNSRGNANSSLAQVASMGIATLELLVYAIFSGIISMFYV